MRCIGGDVVARAEESTTRLGFTVVEILVTLILYTISLGGLYTKVAIHLGGILHYFTHTT